MFKQKNLAAVEKFAKQNRGVLQTVGVVTLAASTGGVTAILVSKSILMAKGIGTAKAVLAAIGTAAAKTGIVATPVVVAPVATSKVAVLLGALVPLTAGVVGGGAIGWTLTQNQVNQVEERLNEQAAQAAAYQAEAERLQTALAAKTAVDTSPASDGPII
ncbi:MAG: hypothetical protein NT075_33725 [Chloroflexi bacterium]|nr:hypothetical protein [Chloroflexota bacterium]